MGSLPPSMYQGPAAAVSPTSWPQTGSATTPLTGMFCAVTRSTWPGWTVTGEIAARSICEPDTLARARSTPSTVRIRVPVAVPGV